MAQEWYYAKDGTKHGPITVQQLKELAASGELRPSDLVWTQGQDEWKPANAVKGLLPESNKIEPPPVPKATHSEPATTSGPTGFASQLPPWVYSWPAAIGSLVCCFPVGLGIVWTHPRWTTQQKSIWSGCWLLLMVIGVVAGPDGDESPTQTDAVRSIQVAPDSGDLPSISKTDEGPTDEEYIELLATGALNLARKQAESGRLETTPEEFNAMMQAIARELNAGGKLGEYQHLLRIEPTSNKELFTGGEQGLLVTYGETNKVIFMLTPHGLALVGATIGDNDWTLNHGWK
jgi:hypothetical protein